MKKSIQLYSNLGFSKLWKFCIRKYLCVKCSCWKIFLLYDNSIILHWKYFVRLIFVLFDKYKKFLTTKIFRIRLFECVTCKIMSHNLEILFHLKVLVRKFFGSKFFVLYNNLTCIQICTIWKSMGVENISCVKFS